MSLIYWLARSGGRLAGSTPRPIRHEVGALLGGASYLGWRSKRLVTQQNMAHVTGRSPSDPFAKRLAFTSWRNYGRYAADFMYFPYVDMDEIERNLYDASEGHSDWKTPIYDALEHGKGVIFATAHFGSWDIAGALAARNFTMSAIAETFSDPQLNELIQNQRKEKGVGIIPMEGSARRILRVLQQNSAVALVMDRPVTAEQGTPVTFFGHTTYVPNGPAALAMKSGAAIVPGYVWYGARNSFLIRTFPAIFPKAESKGEEKKAEMIRLTQYAMSSLEEMVRAWPTQWYMFRPFWPTITTSGEE